ncbi:RNA polymerase sigma factor SigJ [Phenylobacterium sp. LjRoot219]|uniref:RNA polymerase sigma factor SigJ n=1 Tax=Phenylobacterium sp. LjRoot219 TaxID=3342283 RepID=UPI003ED0AC1B
MDTTRTAEFERERGRLQRLAYRMLGSISEAEDVVQDAWLRWTRAGAEVVDPAAWLVRVTTRLCLDRLRAAKAERAAYKGPWLPEPLIEPMVEDPVERAEDVSVAFLLALERLSPLERAVFLLREAFDEDYAAIAQALGRSEPAVRQLAARAKAHVREGRPRFAVDRAQAERLAIAFLTASSSGDASALSAMLAQDAVLVSDGGGKRVAALRVLAGSDDIIHFFQSVAWRNGPAMARTKGCRLARINGLPGVVLELDDGPQTIALELDDEGRISAIYIVRNPEKLGHVAAG